MSSARDVPWAWWIGLALLVPTTLVLITLALREQRPTPDEEDLAMIEGIQRAMLGAEDVDFDALPRDLEALDPDRAMPYLFRGFELCGSIDLSRFEGEWQPVEASQDWASPRVSDGRLQAGEPLRMELCPVYVLEREADRLLAVAVWHEDLLDPGDASLTYLELRRVAATLEVRFGDRRYAVGGKRPAVLRAAGTP